MSRAVRPTESAIPGDEPEQACCGRDARSAPRHDRLTEGGGGGKHADIVFDQGIQCPRLLVAEITAEPHSLRQWGSVLAQIVHFDCRNRDRRGTRPPRQSSHAATRRAGDATRRRTQCAAFQMSAAASLVRGKIRGSGTAASRTSWAIMAGGQVGPVNVNLIRDRHLDGLRDGHFQSMRRATA